MTTWERAYRNVERHYLRTRENETLVHRFHPSLSHYFAVAEEIRAIRLRDAERALAALSN